MELDLAIYMWRGSSRLHTANEIFYWPTYYDRKDQRQVNSSLPDVCGFEVIAFFDLKQMLCYLFASSASLVAILACW